ncbi:MAG: hypothetical protein H0V09_06675 [Gemmatimonadetes bacterium]|nr:hypothetical protein [Gemmatimonadota bacterium]
MRADSSRVHFLIQVGDSAVVGSIPGVLGALTFREESGGFVGAEGRMQLDLTGATLADTLRTRMLREQLEPAGPRESSVAELRVRDLFGKRFKTDLPLGGVLPVSIRGQLLVRGRAVSRQFDGEITRTPGGWRLTNAQPIVFSFEEVGLREERDAWFSAREAVPARGPVAISVDLRLERRVAAEARSAE